MNNIVKMSTACAALAFMIASWSPLGAADTEQVATLSDHRDSVTHLQFDQAGANLLSSDPSGAIKTWGVFALDDDPVFEKRRKGVRTAIYSPDGASYVTADRKGRVHFYNLLTGDKEKELTGATPEPRVLAMSSDGRFIATGGVGNSITVWEMPLETPVDVLDGHAAEISSLVFSPDNSMLISGDRNGEMMIWEVETAYQVESIDNGAPIASIAISPNGKMVAVACENVVKIRDIASGNVIITLNGHEGQINDIAYSPNGKFLISGSDDGSAKLWATTTGRLLTTMQLPEGGVRAVAFSPTGTMVAAGNHKVINEEGKKSGNYDIHLYDITEEYSDNDIMADVERELYHWQKKGEFEKRSEHEARLRTIDRKTGEFFTQAFEEISRDIEEEVAISNYDAENETFMISMPTLGSVTIHVPIDRAQAFKKDFHKAVFRNFVVKPVVNLPMQSSFELISMEIYIPSLQESFYYGKDQANASSEVKSFWK